MAKKYRYLRCPNCNFEHLTLGELRHDAGRPITPWKCPVCQWSGEIQEDRKLTRRPPKKPLN
jgi:hypothetical protein